MRELAADLGEEQKFDAIIVDEAQDFGAAWWPPTLACLRDQETGGLYASTGAFSFSAATRRDVTRP